MRMSDWSSDVFSSVLSRTGRQQTVHVLRTPRIQGVKQRRCARNCVGQVRTDAALKKLVEPILVLPHGRQMKGRLAVRVSLCRVRSGGKQVDRNSVVSGKSVSVRVDLGGPRLFKKKRI